MPHRPWHASRRFLPLMMNERMTAITKIEIVDAYAVTIYGRICTWMTERSKNIFDGHT
jgi:hypothetical protein